MLISMRSIVRVLCTLVLLVQCGSGYKILAVLHAAARSHYIVSSSLMKELARQGHEVTVISPYPLKKPMDNFRDIPIDSINQIMEAEKDKLLDTLNKSIMENVISFHEMGLRITKAVFLEPAVQDLLKSNETFDAVICEVFLSEALFGFSEHFKAPLIGLGTFGAHPWNTDMVGSPSPPSYVPSAMLPLTDRMTLLQRIGNLAYLTFERVFMDYYYLPRQNEIYKEYLPHLKRSLDDIRRNTALVLLNSHVSISAPRPYVPNQIEVGGMHINHKRSPLPENIKQFIEEAKHGVVYFSMGSNLKSKNLPLEMRREILNTFKGLKQRVLWKFEDPNLEGKPDNVFISDWFPQDDILAHDNVLAFITHGGLLSTTESIYHGKPFIGIPIFGDQFLNMARAVNNGYGIMLDYKTLNTADFKAAIERITTDKTYMERIREMQGRFRDQIETPMERAVYWVKHVIRHNGGRYLHCAGMDLNFIQYHNIDAIVILYGGILLVIVLLVCLIRSLLRLVFCRGSCKKPEKKLKKH